jgi:hypothetical protein
MSASGAEDPARLNSHDQEFGCVHRPIARQSELRGRPAFSTAFGDQRDRHAYSQPYRVGAAVLFQSDAQAICHRRAHAVHFIPRSDHCTALVGRITFNNQLKPRVASPQRGPPSAQIPIAECAARRGPANVPKSRFPPLEVFVRRPPECAAAFGGGRHPKTFTKRENPPYGRMSASAACGHWSAQGRSVGQARTYCFACLGARVGPQNSFGQGGGMLGLEEAGHPRRCKS